MQSPQHGGTRTNRRHHPETGAADRMLLGRGRPFHSEGRRTRPGETPNGCLGRPSPHLTRTGRRSRRRDGWKENPPAIHTPKVINAAPPALIPSVRRQVRGWPERRRRWRNPSKATSRRMTAEWEAYFSSGKGKGGWNKRYRSSAATSQRAQTDTPAA